MCLQYLNREAAFCLTSVTPDDIRDFKKLQQDKLRRRRPQENFLYTCATENPPRLHAGDSLFSTQNVHVSFRGGSKRKMYHKTR